MKLVSNKSPRVPAEIEKDMGFKAATIGQLYHQKKCIDWDLDQNTAQLNELCKELAASREHFKKEEGKNVE